MRIALAATALSLALTMQPSMGAEIMMSECEARVATINETLPMSLDNITTWVKTSCTDLGSNAIGLIYENRVQDGNPITQQDLDNILPSLITSWCFGPVLSPLMRLVDNVNYQYYYESKQVIGQLDFSYQNCFAAP